MSFKKNQTNKTKVSVSTSLVQSVTVIVIVIKVCILIEGVHLLKNGSMHIYDVHLSLKVWKKDSRILQMHNKGNNKITELRTILQMESQNS